MRASTCQFASTVRAPATYGRATGTRTTSTATCVIFISVSFLHTMRPTGDVYKARCHGESQQDEADVAREPVRDHGLAVDLQFVHRRGHGAPGVRCAGRRHAARPHRHGEPLADAP